MGIGIILTEADLRIGSWKVKENPATFEESEIRMRAVTCRAKEI